MFTARTSPNLMNKTFSAGGVVVGPHGRVLVVNQNNNSWSLPKGHIDAGEEALEAAKREIHEESGIDELTFVRDLGSYERPKLALGGGDDRSEIKNIHMFLFKTSRKVLKPIDRENPEAQWVEKEKVAGLLTHPKDKQFFLSVMGKI